MTKLRSILCMSALLAGVGSLVLIAPAVCLGSGTSKPPMDHPAVAVPELKLEPMDDKTFRELLAKHRGDKSIQDLMSDHHKQYFKQLKPVSVVTPDAGLRSEPTAHQAKGKPLLVTKRVHLRKGQVPGVLQSARVEVQPGAVVDGHAHETATELFYGLDGECVLSIHNGKDWQRHAVSAGVSIAVGPNTKHMLENKSNFVCHIHVVMVAPPSTGL